MSNLPNNLPSTVVVDGEVDPYTKKIVSKYETIVDKSSTHLANNGYASRDFHERHYTTIGKFSDHAGDLEYNKTSKDILVLDREVYGREQYDGTLGYVPAADRYEIDEILRRYET